MFPTLVWKLQLQPTFRAALDPRILALLESMRRDRPAAGEGWQSATTLHEREELRELVACVEHAARGVLRFLRVGVDELQTTGCWATILACGAAHRVHSHPNNFLSAVYYLRVHPGADSINFHDPRAQTGIIRPPVTALTAENTDQVVVRVTGGTLLVFPSWLQHSVDATTAERERISISFNLMFPSFPEHVAKPLW
ncbi:MAG: 2OG-Fe(II) oxygenase family protein [Burkholderiales bacterium]|jgi:uncharacterized protein (TIGR02466 family)